MTGGERRGRRAIVLALVGVVAVVAVGVAALLVLRDDGSSGEQEAAAAAVARFVDAVNRGAPEEGGTVEPPGEVAAEYTAAVAGLGEEASVRVEAGEVVLDGDGAAAPLQGTWQVAGASWTSSGTLTLERAEGAGWRARWALSALDDRLRAGDALSVEATDPDRAPVLAGDGQPLVSEVEVVVVGVQPGRVEDVDDLSARLALVLDVDGPALAARIRAAEPDHFVEVVTLRRSDYLPIRDLVRPLPGTVFREETQLLAPSRSFARAVLGTVGPATAEQVEASDGRLQPGDLTGSGGVQERYDAHLAGTPGLVVTVSRAGPGEGATTTTEAGAEGETEVLARVEPVAGRPVATTLDVAVQEAAEAALADEQRVASIVAVRVGTSEVLAVANAPSGSSAAVGLRAQVPPGSTFKVVSALALLRRGLTPDEVVACPETAVVGGREFGNAGGFSLGDVPFRTDFARSCNTAFVSLVDRLEPDDLTRAAADLGLGAGWDVGLPANPGSVPPTEGPVDAAAASIGQGRIQVSPLGMAVVAASVAAGRFRAPSLVVEPAPEEAPPEVPLDPGHAEVLRELMRAVVTEGTGSALADVPGGEVHAKTGTAEFGTDDPPRAHAWIIGHQGDVAFAVFVEGGESGSGVAAPLAARFLTELAAR